MIHIVGRFFARCNGCGLLHRFNSDTSGLYVDYSSYEREMGPSVDYHYSDERICDYGNQILINMFATEYPVGAIEQMNYQIIGAEVTRQPQIDIDFSPDDYYAMGPSHFSPENAVRQMSDRTFELFAASVLEAMGYSEVTVTKRTRDGACDFTAFDYRYGIRNFVIGECKHYSPGHKVGDEVIRKLHDAQYQQHANTAIVVTSSTFTRNARNLALEYNMTLWDIDDLIRLGGHLLKDYF